MFEREITMPENLLEFSVFSLPKLSCFETVEKDASGNHHYVMGKGNSKIQIIFRIDSAGVLVGKQIDNGYEVTILGDEKYLADAVLYDEELPVGTLRSRKENQYFFEAFDKKADFADKILYKKTDSICKGERLYGENLDSNISKILAKNLKDCKLDFDKQVHFTLWNASFSGENGLVTGIRHVNPDQIVFLSIAESKKFSKDCGAAFVLKDGNYVLPAEQKTVIKQWANEEGIPFDCFVGKTDNIMELLDMHSFGKTLMGIYLPVRYFDTVLKEVFLSDIEKTRNILLKYITNM